jgi:general secretion pathway protein J
MMQPPLRSRNAGFTLVEVLVATLLMAFILGALATVTAQWLPNWNRGFARAQRIQLLAVGMERLVADLSAAQIVSAGSADDPPIFDGTELSVTFVRTALGPTTLTGLEVVRMAEITDNHGPALVRMTAPFAPVTVDAFDRGQFNFSNPVVLIRPPYRVFFSYAGRDRQWRDSWRAEPQLPRAIRFRIRDAATSETLAVSTSALIHAELPARWQKPQQGVR